MLLLLVAISVLQMLHGLDAYVVIQPDGYWRSAPQYYYYYPYYWGYPTQASGELADLRHNQKTILDVLKCLTEQDAKGTCKIMLDAIVMPMPLKKPEPAVVSTTAPPPVEAPADTEAPADPSTMMTKQDAAPGDVNDAFTSS